MVSSTFTAITTELFLCKIFNIYRGKCLVDIDHRGGSIYYVDIRLDFMSFLFKLFINSKLYGTRYTKHFFNLNPV